MRIPASQALAIIAVVCLLTYLTRACAFLLFSGKRGMPDAVAYLGRVLPAAVMVILVVYCLRGVSPTVYPHGLPEAIGVAVVVLLHLWKRNNLLSIGVGTAVYMFLVQAVFI